MQEYPVYTLRQLGLVLRNHRKAQGKTQAVAGGGVGVLAKTVSALESNPGASSVASLCKLLSALDLDLILRPKESLPPKEQKPARRKKGAAKSPAVDW